MNRKRFEKIKLKDSSNMTAALLLVLVSVVVISLLSNRHYIHWDITATGEHTLSDKTLQVLKSIQEPVNVKAFVRVGFPEGEEVKRLLSGYRYHNPGISFELIDPERNPAVTRSYKVRNYNTLILEGYKKSQILKNADEQGLTNGLIRLSKNDTNKVYWLTGHGERDFMSQEPSSMTIIKENLSKENFQLKELNLMQKEIPDDASIVVIAAPLKPLFPEEVRGLERYFRNGGNIIIFLEPFKDGGLKDFLKVNGIIISEDMIVDKLSRIMGGDFLMPMITRYGSHEITKDFRVASIFSTARSIEASRDREKGVSLTALASTSSNAWSETDQASLKNGTVKLDPKDRRGPISLAVIAEPEPSPGNGKVQEEKKSSDLDNPATMGKMIVFGDSDFASNRFFNMQGNGDLVTNAFNYLAGREDLIIIKKEKKPGDPLLLTLSQGRILFWIPVVILPLLVLTIGVMIMVRRRSR